MLIIFYLFVEDLTIIIWNYGFDVPQFSQGMAFRLSSSPLEGEGRDEGERLNSSTPYPALTLKGRGFILTGTPSA